MKRQQEENPIAGVMDYETGEIIGEIMPGDRIVHDQESAYKFDFNNDQSFVKFFYNTMDELKKQCTNAELILLMQLTKFISYDDCILRKGGHHNGKMLTMKELAEELGMTYDALRKNMLSLKKKGIVGTHQTGCKDKPDVTIKALTVNPYIFFKGQKLNKTIEAFYKESNWK